MNRRFTFSDPRVIERLRTQFIAVSGNTHDLQWGHSAARDWFMTMAERTESEDLRKQRREGDTVQGVFIAGPDGTSYGWRNVESPDLVLGLMENALSLRGRTKERRVDIPASAADEAFTETPDPSTSVIRVFSRIQPLPAGCDDANRGVGRDHLWVLKGEVQEMLDRTHPSNPFPMPASLVARMVRFHLIDNVRGEPDMWTRKDIRRVAFSMKRARAAGQMRTFSFEGTFAQGEKDGHRGQEGRIHGEFDVDANAARISRFRAYSEGLAWGASQYTTGEPKGRFPLVIAMVEAEDPVARIVAPEALTNHHDRQGYLHPE